MCQHLAAIKHWTDPRGGLSWLITTDNGEWQVESLIRIRAVEHRDYTCRVIPWSFFVLHHHMYKLRKSRCNTINTTIHISWLHQYSNDGIMINHSLSYIMEWCIHYNYGSINTPTFITPWYHHVTSSTIMHRSMEYPWRLESSFRFLASTLKGPGPVGQEVVQLGWLGVSSWGCWFGESYDWWWL